MAKKYLSQSNFGVGFKLSLAKPIDDRFVVDSVDDLYSVDTWKVGNLVALYTGLTVAIGDGSGSLYTYTGVAGDSADFSTSLESGLIPKSKWVIQGGQAAADLSALTARVQATEEAIKSKADNDTLSGVAKSGKAEDVAIDDAGNLITATSVEGAIQEIAKKVNDNAESAKVTLEHQDGTLQYVIKQGDQTMTINIPKDMVVESGEVITAETDDQEHNVVAGKKYIKLVIANSSSVLYIAVDDLVDVYTVKANADKVQLAISDANELSASIKAGSIAKTDLTADVQTAIDTVATNTTAISGLSDRIGTLEGAQISATGDDYVSASVEGSAITVGATDKVKNAIAVVGKLKSAAYKDSADFVDSTSYATDKAELDGKIQALGSVDIKAGDNISITNVDSVKTISAKVQALSTDAAISGEDGAHTATSIVPETDGLVTAKNIAAVIDKTNAAVAAAQNKADEAAQLVNDSKITAITVNGKAATIKSNSASVTVGSEDIAYSDAMTVKAAIADLYGQTAGLEWTEVTAEVTA